MMPPSNVMLPISICIPTGELAYVVSVSFVLAVSIPGPVPTRTQSFPLTIGLYCPAVVATNNPPPPVIAPVVDATDIGRFEPDDVNRCCPVNTCGLLTGVNRA